MKERWLDSIRGAMTRGLTVSAFVILMTLALLAGGLVAFVVVRSGDDEAHQLAGRWTVGLRTQRGPEAELVGQSLSCRSILTQTGTTLSGELECDSQGTKATIQGFVLAGRDDLRLSAEFDDFIIDILAQVVSPVQLVGSWEDSQGFTGRFVAIKDQLASD